VKPFIGILFFYTLAFNKLSKRKEEWIYISQYLNDKADRYLEKEVTKSDWELLKIKTKDFPQPGSDNHFTEKQHLELIDIFHDIFGKTNYDLRMYGVAEEIEIEQFDNVFDEFEKYLDIIGSSNGVGLLLCDWLSKSKYNRKNIERHYKLSELITR
jgi:hypothetical protein